MKGSGFQYCIPFPLLTNFLNDRMICFNVVGNVGVFSEHLVVCVCFHSPLHFFAAVVVSGGGGEGFIFFFVSLDYFT